MNKKTIFLILAALICVGAFSLYLGITSSRVDAQPPVISLSDEMLEISVHDPKDLYLQGVTASDDVSGDVTASIVVESVNLVDTDGSIQVTYAAFDGAGNVTKATREARFTDYRSPQFDLTRSLTFHSNYTFNIFNIVKANDVIDGDISYRVRVAFLEEMDNYTVGVTPVEIRVSNSMGETVKLEIPVERYAAGDYEATLTLTDYLVYLPKGMQLNAESFLDTFSRSDIGVSLRNGLPEGYSLELKNDVNPDVPGVYTVEYRVTETAGTEEKPQNYTGYCKMIVVVEG